jgi:hypothetical protein
MSKKAFAVIIKPLIDLHGEPKNWNVKIGIYFDALSDLPELLLDKAVRHCIACCEFFPKPAELRKAVLDELSDYRRQREEARLAALPKPPEPSPPSPEDIAHVAEVMSQIRGILSGRTAVMRGE